MSPSCGLQLFQHCSRMGPFLSVHSFRSRLLQHGFHTGLQVLPENLLQCGLLFVGCGSCQKSALSWVPHGLHSTSTKSGVFHSPTVGMSPPLWSSPWASGDSLLQHLEHPFHSYSYSSQLLHNIFNSLLNKLSQRYHQSCR